MTDIAVTPMEPGHFGVQVTEGDVTTSHRVEVDEGFVDDLALWEVEPQVLVEETFSFLLEREPATAILPAFALSAVQEFFPEYPDELLTRLSPASG